MSYDNFAETETDKSLLLETANSDSIETIEIPHSEAIFSHLRSLAHVHALQSIKCAGSDASRTTELEDTLESLTRSFSLSEEQIAYLRHAFNEQVARKESFIAHRFTELENRVTEIAKLKIKSPEEEANTSSCDLSKLQQDLKLEDGNIAEKIEKRAARLSENAFLIAVKDLARRRLKKSEGDLDLTLGDLNTLTERFSNLELSPRLLERANELYENTISVT